MTPSTSDALNELVSDAFASIHCPLSIEQLSFFIEACRWSGFPNEKCKMFNGPMLNAGAVRTGRRSEDTTPYHQGKGRAVCPNRPWPSAPLHEFVSDAFASIHCPLSIEQLS